MTEHYRSRPRKALRVLALALPIALASAGVLTAYASDADPSGASTPRPGLDWRPCAEDATAQCATLPVPVNWDQPRGDTVNLALTRRPASDPAARIGSLVVNFGGPGQSTVDDILAGGYFREELARRFDIVGFDARGVGRSDPVRCSTDLVAQAPPWLPTSQADFDRLVAYNQRLRDDCRRHTGPLFDHVDTLSVVRDLEAIRTALGETTLTFYGLSYGTLIGQQYAERYPARVRAIVLDSVEDHSLDTSALLHTSAVSTQESFEQFVAWCDRDSTCVLHGQDVRTLWSGVLARATRGELPFPPDPSRPLRPEELVGFAITAFLGPDWPVLAETLAAFDAGQPAAAFAEAERQSARADLTDFPERAIRCADWSLPVRDYAALAAQLRTTAKLAPDMRLPAVEISHVTDCLGGPARVPNPQHRLQVPDSERLLLVNSRFDPVTGHNWATNVARQLGGGVRLLTYDGWGHGVYGRGQCADTAIDRYLISRTPPTTAHCPAVANR